MKTMQNRRSIRVYCPKEGRYVKVLDVCYAQNCFFYHGLDAFKVECRYDKRVEREADKKARAFVDPEG